MRKILILLLILALTSVAYARTQKLVVMEINDKTKHFKRQSLKNALEYIRGEVVVSGRYVLISEDRQHKELYKSLKKKSYKMCFDKSCQIPLGQALSADSIIVITITKFDKTYIFRLELVDLAQEATVGGATSEFTHKKDFFRAVKEALFQLIHPESKDMILQKQQRERDERKLKDAKKIYNKAMATEKRNLERAVELYEDVINLINNEQEVYSKRAYKRKLLLEDKLEKIRDRKRKKEEFEANKLRLKQESQLIKIKKDNANYYNGNNFDPAKFSEEIGNSDWVFFFKDKLGKYYYNKRTKAVDTFWITVWFRIIRGKRQLEDKIKIICEKREYYYTYPNLKSLKKYKGSGAIPPESFIDYLRASVCK